MEKRIYNVLFICTGNSARSIMAEAILNQLGAGRFKAYSAGSDPAGHVNPRAIELLERNRFNTEGLRSKNWNEFAGKDTPQMDFVLTVCDKAAGQVCPIWPGQPISAHWGVPDPASAEGTDEQVRRVFSEVFMTLNRRVTIFLALPIEKIDQLTLKNELRRIGKE